MTKELQNILEQQKNKVDEWFDSIFIQTTPFIYNSVDIRRSNYKIAPVDTNIFPGGFNNLNEEERIKASLVIKEYLHKYYPGSKNILLVAEDHTRNLYYFENVAVIKEILELAGIKVGLSSFGTTKNNSPQDFESLSGVKLNLKPILREQNILKTADFIPDIILINNDLTDSPPELINNITQPILPPPHFGWHKRRKSEHFSVYNELAENFCKEFALDPWIITTIFSTCNLVNFKEQTGLACLAENVDKTVDKIREKYKQYQIKEDPYVFIKPNRGTYGMGIMTARHGEDVLNLNKDNRKKMNAIKGGNLNSEVVIQEGIMTIDQIDGFPAEPMIYVVAGKPIGCIYRINNKQDALSNLNSSGMHFMSGILRKNESSLCTTLGFIAKLACYSAAWECYLSSYQI